MMLEEACKHQFTKILQKYQDWLQLSLPVKHSCAHFENYEQNLDKDLMLTPQGLYWILRTNGVIHVTEVRNCDGRMVSLEILQ